MALDILDYAKQLLPSLSWTLPPGPSRLHFRAMLAVIINYIYFCRGDCGVSMLARDLAVHDNYITLFLRKVKGRAAHSPHQLPLL